MAWIKLTDTDGGPVLVNFARVGTVVPIDPAYEPHGSLIHFGNGQVGVRDTIGEIATALVTTYQRDQGACSMNEARQREGSDAVRRRTGCAETHDLPPDGEPTGPRLYRG